MFNMTRIRAISLGLHLLLSALPKYGMCLPSADADTTQKVITRDVVIIGGGASGAHAAVRLKDMGRSIVLVEKEAILGGAVDTYTSPGASPIDFGVAVFVDYANSSSFFSRLNISMVTPPAPQAPTLPTRYFDFTSGAELNDYIPPATADVTAALERYLEGSEKYESLLAPGYFDFPTSGSEIPEDLLIPFGEFVKKHNATAAFPSIFTSTGLGVGQPASELTITAMQSFGAQMARVLLGRQAALVPASGRNQDVYDAVAALLLSSGADEEEVLYSTTAISANRTEDDGVTVAVRNRETGVQTTIRAKKLLIAIPPLPDVLAPFDLDAAEAAVFEKWKHTHEYAGLVRSRFLAAAALNGSFSSAANLPLAAEPDHYLQTPEVPFVDQFQRVGGDDDDLFHVLLVGNETTFKSERAAEELVRREFDALRRNFADNGDGGSTDPDLEFVALSDHGPMHLHVSADEYRAGFVRDLYELQGRRSTWYTGAGFASNFQTVLWAYNEILLPKMLAGGS